MRFLLEIQIFRQQILDLRPIFDLRFAHHWAPNSNTATALCRLITHSPVVCRLACVARLLVDACGLRQSEAEFGRSTCPPAWRQLSAFGARAAQMYVRDYSYTLYLAEKIRRCKFGSKFRCLSRDVPIQLTLWCLPQIVHSK